MKNLLKCSLLFGALAVATGSASAATKNLCAGATTKALPDGSSVTIWGYAEGGATGGVCDNTPTLPGPRIVVPAGDPTLTINLTNTLPEPTSIVITSLPMPTPLGPTWNDGSAGARPGPAARVRSFGVEAAAAGAATYTFNGVRPGTFIYHSGTHPQKQVYMGLYGAVTQNAVEAAGSSPAEAYPGVEYFNEVVLFYSEIDPALNTAVAAGTHATSIDYHARWFLVNGEPYVAGMADIALGEDGITPLMAEQKTLVRILSAAGETHVPTLQGMHMSIHGEDGFEYNWQDGATTMASAPREQYSAMMPPLKTKDAMISAPAAGRYAVYDGNGYMTNPSDPTDVTVADSVGGMLRFLAFGGAVNLDPIADAGGPYSGTTGAPVAFDGTGSTDDGAIVSYEWDFDGDTVVDDTGATPSYAYLAGGIYTVTLTVTDDNGAFASDSATATIGVNAAPVANAGGPYTGSAGTAVSFDGTGSTDDGTIVSYEWDFDGDTIIDGTGATPSHTYATAGTYNVTLTVADDGGLSNTSAITTATIAPNQDPVAHPNGPYSGSTGQAIAFDGTASSDVDGTIVSYEWDFDGDTVTDATGATPTHTYTSAGTYTVELTVTDNAGGTNSATTTANIDAANQPPNAEANGPYMVSIIIDGGTASFSSAGSNDPDGSIVSYDWDFGDGQVGSGPSPTNTYAAASTYIATLTVTDDDGAMASDAAVVYVVDNQAPVAVDDMAAVPRGNNVMTFIDLTSNDWDFEDGAVDPNSIVITSLPDSGAVAVVAGGIEYTNQGGGTGTYFVGYTVQDSDGATSNEATVTINIVR